MLHVPSEEESNEGEDATGRSHVFDPSDRGTCLGCGETVGGLYNRSTGRALFA